MKTGDAIPLYLQLATYETGKYPRAFVRDDTGAEIAGSPVDLAAVDALGLYSDASLLFPATRYVTAQFVVYDDSDHTVVSGSDGGSAQTFFQDPAPGTSPPTSNIVGNLDALYPVPPDNGVQDIVVKGSDRTLLIRLVTGDNDEPFDLTQTTSIACHFINADGSVLAVAGAVVLAAAGKMSVGLTAAQTANLLAMTPVPFTAILTTTGGVIAVNFPNQLAVQDAFA